MLWYSGAGAGAAKSHFWVEKWDDDARIFSQITDTTPHLPPSPTPHLLNNPNNLYNHNDPNDPDNPKNR